MRQIWVPEEACLPTPETGKKVIAVGNASRQSTRCARRPADVNTREPGGCVLPVVKGSSSENALEMCYDDVRESRSL